MLNRTRLAAFVIAMILIALPSAAQEFTPGNLPAGTSLVLYLHGAGPMKPALASNPMMKVWYAPEFAQFRLQTIEYYLRQMNLQSPGHPIRPTPENADRILSLLENPMIFGVSSSSADLFGIGQPPSHPNAGPLNNSGLFFILDTTGKNEQFEKLWPEIMATISKEVTRSSFEVAGTRIDKFTGLKNTSFSAHVGNHFILTNQRSVMEELLTRLRSGTSTADSLSQDADFQHCRANLDPGTLFEGFFRVPDFSKITVPSATPQMDSTAMVKGLHLESFHAVCASFAVNSDSSRLRAVVLADSGASGILSIFGANRSHFETLGLAPDSAYSISVTSFDLSAFYKLIRSTVSSSLSQDQQSAVAMGEMLGASQLGMPLPDAFALFSGEYASVNLEANATMSSQLYAVTITDSQQVLALIHKLSGLAHFTDEKQENGVTYMTFGASPSAVPPPAGTTPATPYYLAVAPHLVLLSSNVKYLREAAARYGSHGASLDDNPEVVNIRAAFPHDVFGLSITDYSRYDWPAFVSNIFDKASSQTAAKLSPEDAAYMEMVKHFPWKTLTGSLHWSVGAWWRDTDGIHFDSFTK